MTTSKRVSPAAIVAFVRARARAFAVGAGVAVAGGLVAWCGCGQHGGPTAKSGDGAHPAGDAATSGAVASAGAQMPVSIAAGEDLWAVAQDGGYEADDLARLAAREGASGLVEGVESDGARKHTAVLALAYADGFEGLPFLADVAATGDEKEARAAVDTAAQLASRPRLAEDPEDAPELRAGCDKLLAVAKDPGRPRAVRVGAIRTLRMLEDRGCVKDTDLPTDLNAK